MGRHSRSKHGLKSTHIKVHLFGLIDIDSTTDGEIVSNRTVFVKEDKSQEIQTHLAERKKRGRAAQALGRRGREQQCAGLL